MSRSALLGISTFLQRILDTASKDYWFLSGDYAGVYVDHELEIIVTEHIPEVFKDSEDGFEELFDELQEWYADHVPKASAYDENKNSFLP